MIVKFLRIRLVIGVFVLATSLSFNAPWAQADVKMHEQIVSSGAPAHLQQLAHQLLMDFRYRSHTGRAWIGARDKQGRLVGNCTVFARASAGVLSAVGYLPRFVNVQVPSPERGQDPKHVVTVVTAKDQNRWVFDNRSPYLYAYPMLASLYQRERVARYSGVQRLSWGNLKNTVKEKNQ